MSTEFPNALLAQSQIWPNLAQFFQRIHLGNIIFVVDKFILQCHFTVLNSKKEKNFHLNNVKMLFQLKSNEEEKPMLILWEEEEENARKK